MEVNKRSRIIKITATFLTIILSFSLMLFIPSNTRTSKAGDNKSGVKPDYLDLVFDKEKVNEINIKISEDDWKWLMDNASKEEYKSCSITINGENYDNVAIRPKGNSSLSQIANGRGETKRFSFKIDFNKYVEGQTYHGLQEMVLNNVMSDKSYMKESLSYEIFDYIGVASPAFAYSDIKINNKNWGLYLAVETINESFISRTLGITGGNLYKPEGMDMGGREKNQQNGLKDMPKNMSPNNMSPNNMPPNDMSPNNMSPNNQSTNNMSPNNQSSNNQSPNNMPTRDSGNVGGSVRENIRRNNEQSNKMGLNDGDIQNKGGFGGFGGFGGMGARGGTNLKYTDDSPSSYSVIKDGAVYKTTTDNDFKKVIEMIKKLNNGTDLESVIDVDEILRFWAANTFLVNLDSYAGGMYHNYYLYEKNGFFTLLPWDFNLSFAGFTVNDSSNAINFPIDKPVTGNLEDAPLIGKLLEVKEYKELYHKYLKDISENYINNKTYENSINNMDKLISSYVKNDATAFYTFEEYEKALIAMVTFGEDRAKSVFAQLDGSQPATSYGKIATTLNLSDLGSMGGMGGGGKGSFGNDNNKNGQSPNNMPGNMQMPENMGEIIQIVSEANGKELTDDQKKKLKELGADENMINRFTNMQGGMGFPGGGPMGDRPGGGDPWGQQSNNKNNISTIIIIATSVLALLLTVIVLVKRKSKRYVVCDNK